VYLRVLSIFSLCLFLFACKQEKKQTIHEQSTSATTKVESFEPHQHKPEFNADSAFAYIEKQLSFGYRVPGTPEHKKCAQWLKQKMASYSLDVEVQEATVTAFNKKELNIFNITARYNATNPNRIMIFAHWDTRPFADRDTDKRNKPIEGANDGASGVAVIIELARSIFEAQHKPEIGIDFVFFDAEDYGEPDASMVGGTEDSWCLGSQYWAQHLPPDYIKPKYGILLDMVGAKDAVFPKEGVSVHYAPQLLEKVWKLAAQLGYQDLFVNQFARGGITDDHLYVNKMASIPSINIIHYHTNTLDFGHFHHTHKDNISIIHKPTLFAVGNLMLELIYREN
jgi:glutaminyl-peptide cyclotransferase